MKKIITLITMFVLSAGCLMAQGVFNYQAIVYDGTSLVVDEDVTALVTITDGTHTFTQTLPDTESDFPTLHTSPNGLVVLQIGLYDDPDFAAIDWSKASIKVDFTVVEGNASITGVAEQIPAVPFALQTDDELNTPMIVDYIQHASMENVNAILAATEQNLNGNTSLHHAVLAAVVDTIKNNYKLAKDIFLSYMHDADAADVQQLFEALAGNQDVVDTLLGILKDTLETDDGKALVFDVLKAYAMQTTGADVDAVWAAIPAEVKDEVVRQALQFLLTPDGTLTDDAKNYLVIPILMNYIQTITEGEVQQMINAAVNNNDPQTGAFPVLLDQFNDWMDEYFENHYTGDNGSGVDVNEVVANTIEENYYAQCTPAIDLCQLYQDLQPGEPVCFALVDYNSDGFVFAAPNAEGFYVGHVRYQGDATIALSSISIEGEQSGVTFDYSYEELQGHYDFFSANGVITVKIDADFLVNNIEGQGDSFGATIVLSVTGNPSSCGDVNPITIVGHYVEEGGDDADCSVVFEEANGFAITFNGDFRGTFHYTKGADVENFEPTGIYINNEPVPEDYYSFIPLNDVQGYEVVIDALAVDVTVTSQFQADVNFLYTCAGEVMDASITGVYSNTGGGGDNPIAGDMCLNLGTYASSTCLYPTNQNADGFTFTLQNYNMNVTEPSIDTHFNNSIVINDVPQAFNDINGYVQVTQDIEGTITITFNPYSFNVDAVNSFVVEFNLSAPGCMNGDTVRLCYPQQ